MKHKRKKRAMVAICVAMVILGGSFRITKTTATGNELFSANIEALTSEETGTFKYPTAHAYKMTCNADMGNRKKM